MRRSGTPSASTTSTRAQRGAGRAIAAPPSARSFVAERTSFCARSRSCSGCSSISARSRCSMRWVAITAVSSRWLLTSPSASSRPSLSRARMSRRAAPASLSGSSSSQLLGRGGGGCGGADFALIGLDSVADDRFLELGGRTLSSGLMSRAPGIATRMASSVANGPWISCWPNSLTSCVSTRYQPTSDF